LTHRERKKREHAAANSIYVEKIFLFHDVIFLLDLASAGKLNNPLWLLNSRNDGGKIAGRGIKRASLSLSDARRNSVISGAAIAPYEHEF
jgi:hypothetical protein